MSPALDAETPLPEGLQPDTPRTLEVLPLVRERGSDTPLAGRCASPLANRPGRYCTSPPKRGKTRCRMHGGSSRSGIAHPNFKHGFYAKDTIGSLGADYSAARQHPDLISHIEEVALTTARVSELLRQLRDVDTLPSWDRVASAHAALTTFQESQKTRDVSAMMDSLTTMKADLAALMDGREAAAQITGIWAQLMPMLTLHRKLVDSESRRRKDAQEMITKEKVLAIVGFVAGSIARHVPDMRQRQAVVEDMRLLMAGAPRP